VGLGRLLNYGLSISKKDRINIVKDGEAENRKYRADIKEIILETARNTRKKELAKKRKEAFDLGNDLDGEISNLDTSFSRENGKIYIQGKGILISKRKDTKELLLLSALFENNGEILYADEFFEKYEFDVKKSPKILYTAAKKINSKIASEISVKDFILYGLGYAQINPKYIS
jgi:DNA-binding response OmpR family regulator